MKVNGIEVVAMPLDVLEKNLYCPVDIFKQFDIMKEFEIRGYKKSNDDIFTRAFASDSCPGACKKCWIEVTDKINELYGVTAKPTIIEIREEEK